jgi:hypothetical protein
MHQGREAIPAESIDLGYDADVMTFGPEVGQL